MILKFADCESILDVERVYEEEKRRIESELKCLEKFRTIFLKGLNN